MSNKGAKIEELRKRLYCLFNWSEEELPYDSSAYNATKLEIEQMEAELAALEETCVCGHSKEKHTKGVCQGEIIAQSEMSILIVSELCDCKNFKL